MGSAFEVSETGGSARVPPSMLSVRPGFPYNVTTAVDTRDEGGCRAALIISPSDTPTVSIPHPYAHADPHCRTTVALVGPRWHQVRSRVRVTS